MIASFLRAQNIELPPFRSEIPEIIRSRQLIIVTTQQWDDIFAQIHFFERKNNLSDWKESLSPCDAVVGKKGFAWGIGLHGSAPLEKDRGSLKKEGDLCAPAGVFELDEAFGYASEEEAAINTFPYRKITPTAEAVDDPNSHYYNRIVDTLNIDDKDWNSSEIMLRADDLYRWGVVVKNNWESYPEYGSAIFLHIWRNPQCGTAGCTATSSKNVEAILHRLDTTKYPLLIQLPVVEYKKLKKPWHLPDLDKK